MKTTLKMTAIVLLWLLSADSYGQTLSNFYQSGYYDFQTLDNFPKADFFSTYGSQLGLTSDDVMTEHECNDDENTGRFSCRYDQYYKGYRVEGASFVLHGQHGLVLSAGGSLVTSLNLSVTSPISESTALGKVLDSLELWEYEWDDTIAEKLLKESVDDNNASNYPQGELIIAQIATEDETISAENFRFVWKFGVRGKRIVGSDTPSFRYRVYVDASSGDVVNVFDPADFGGSYHTGNVLTAYDGWNTFRTWKCDVCDDYRLRADRGQWIWTSWNNFGPTGNSPFTQGPHDDDNNWSAPNERSTVSAHWAAKVAWEYFSQEHGRDGSDGQGMRLNIYTSRNPGSVNNYAAYTDDENYPYDKIEVGEPIDGYTPASLDVIGHEYTHAYIRRSSGINKKVGNKDALALNEGYADIFGHMIERSIRHSEDWNVGGDVIYSSVARKYRIFSDPNTSSPAQPREYGDFFWDNNKNPHINSGVLLQWFYWFANGNGQLLPSIQGVGIEKAADIAWGVMNWYLWPGVTYHDCRNQTLGAIADWYGKCSFEYVQAYKAWNAVNITGPTPCKFWQLHGPAVVTQEQMGEPTDGYIELRIFQSGETEITEDPESVVWVVPDGWDYEISEDNLTLTITDAVSDASAKVKAYVTYSDGGNDVTDSLEHILHFVCEGCGDGRSSGGNNNNEEHAANLSNATKKKIQASAKTVDNIRIYPNPVSEKKINIVVPASLDGNTMLHISSITGVKYKSVSLDKVKNVVALDELATGMYIFELSNGTETRIERIFVQ